MSIETLRLANAGAWLPCPNATYIYEEIDGTKEFCCGPECGPKGHGGWVYALPDAVREPCKCGGKQYIEPEHLQFFCPFHCKGRGWIPATDGWAWWQAGKAAGLSMTLELVHGEFQAAVVWDDEAIIYRAFGPDPEHVFQEALNKALTAMGGARFPSTVSRASGGFHIKGQPAQSHCLHRISRY